MTDATASLRRNLAAAIETAMKDQGYYGERQIDAVIGAVRRVLESEPTTTSLVMPTDGQVKAYLEAAARVSEEGCGCLLTDEDVVRAGLAAVQFRFLNPDQAEPLDRMGEHFEVKGWSDDDSDQENYCGFCSTEAQHGLPAHYAEWPCEAAQREMARVLKRADRSPEIAAPTATESHLRSVASSLYRRLDALTIQVRVLVESLPATGATGDSTPPPSGYLDSMGDLQAKVDALWADLIDEAEEGRIRVGAAREIAERHMLQMAESVAAPVQPSMRSTNIAEVDRRAVEQMTAREVFDRLRRAENDDSGSAGASYDLDYAGDLLDALDAELAVLRAQEGSAAFDEARVPCGVCGTRFPSGSDPLDLPSHQCVPYPTAQEQERLLDSDHAPQMVEVTSGELRDGDTVTITGTVRRARGAVGEAEVYVDSRLVNDSLPFILTGDASITVTRPASPDPMTVLRNAIDEAVSEAVIASDDSRVHSDAVTRIQDAVFAAVVGAGVVAPGTEG